MRIAYVGYQRNSRVVAKRLVVVPLDSVTEHVKACCTTCAHAEFLHRHNRDRAVDELNKIYSIKYAEQVNK
jgi:hypothetical protein